MQNMNDLNEAIGKEARRIEEDSIHSAKSHFNAADIWNKRHYWLGIPATMLGAAAGAAMIKESERDGLFNPSRTFGSSHVRIAYLFYELADDRHALKMVRDVYSRCLILFWTLLRCFLPLFKSASRLG